MDEALSEVTKTEKISETLVTSIEEKSKKDEQYLLDSRSKRVVSMIKKKLSAIEVEKRTIGGSSAVLYESSKMTEVLTVLKGLQTSSTLTETSITTLEEFEDEADSIIEAIKDGSKGGFKDSESFKKTTDSVLKTINKKVDEANKQIKITEKAETASEVSNYLFVIKEYTTELTETSVAITKLKELIANILDKKWNVELIEEFEKYTLEIESLIESGTGVSGVSELSKTIEEKTSKLRHLPLNIRKNNSKLKKL